MGNIPDRWAGRGASLALGVLLAICGFFVGQLVGHRLAYGFTFDWYKLGPRASFPASDALFAAALVAAGAAVLAIALVVPLAAVGTRFWAARVRYVPPRYSAPRSVDVHAGLLLALLGGGLGLVAALVGYVVLASPMLQHGSIISAVSPSGYELLLAGAGALGAGVAGAVAGWSTFAGTVSGRIAKDAERNLIAN